LEGFRCHRLLHIFKSWSRIGVFTQNCFFAQLRRAFAWPQFKNYFSILRTTRGLCFIMFTFSYSSTAPPRIILPAMPTLLPVSSGSVQVANYFSASFLIWKMISWGEQVGNQKPHAFQWYVAYTWLCQPYTRSESYM
jgi:hypothetical protein